MKNHCLLIMIYMHVGTWMKSLFGWPGTLAKRRAVAQLTLMYKLVNRLVPESVCSIITSPLMLQRLLPINNLIFPTLRLVLNRSINHFFLQLSGAGTSNLLKLEIRPRFGYLNKKYLNKFQDLPNFPRCFTSENRSSTVNHTCFHLGASPLNSH